MQIWTLENQFDSNGFCDIVKKIILDLRSGITSNGR